MDSEFAERDTAGETLTSSLKDQELYNTGATIGDYAELFGFKKEE
jgi:hypothetical protein